MGDCPGEIPVLDQSMAKGKVLAPFILLLAEMVGVNCGGDELDQIACSQRLRIARVERRLRARGYVRCIGAGGWMRHRCDGSLLGRHWTHAMTLMVLIYRLFRSREVGPELNINVKAVVRLRQSPRSNNLTVGPLIGEQYGR
jgi:hypothetical protein